MAYRRTGEPWVRDVAMPAVRRVQVAMALVPMIGAALLRERLLKPCQCLADDRQAAHTRAGLAPSRAQRSTGVPDPCPAIRAHDHSQQPGRAVASFLDVELSEPYGTRRAAGDPCDRKFVATSLADRFWAPLGTISGFRRAAHSRQRRTKSSTSGRSPLAERPAASGKRSGSEGNDQRTDRQDSGWMWAGAKPGNSNARSCRPFVSRCGSNCECAAARAARTAAPRLLPARPTKRACAA